MIFFSDRVPKSSNPVTPMKTQFLLHYHGSFLLFEKLTYEKVLYNIYPKFCKLGNIFLYFGDISKIRFHCVVRIQIKSVQTVSLIIIFYKCMEIPILQNIIVALNFQLYPELWRKWGTYHQTCQFSLDLRIRDFFLQVRILDKCHHFSAYFR